MCSTQDVLIILSWSRVEFPSLEIVAFCHISARKCDFTSIIPILQTQSRYFISTCFAIQITQIFIREYFIKVTLNRINRTWIEIDALEWNQPKEHFDCDIQHSCAFSFFFSTVSASLFWQPKTIFQLFQTNALLGEWVEFIPVHPKLILFTHRNLMWILFPHGISLRYRLICRWNISIFSVKS